MVLETQQYVTDLGLTGIFLDSSDRLQSARWGAYIGGGEVCRLMTMLTAASLQATVYAVDYRMRPFHPYPAVLDDCVMEYRFLLDRYRPDQIIVMGPSAGGNLAAALMLRCHAKQLPCRPA
jgi:monoterpene epsilon-lactone hydrolase